MKIVTVTNQKGGVGKTTTAHVLACGLSKRGFKVIVIDTDPQTNLTFTAGIDPQKSNLDLYDLFNQKGNSLEAIQTSQSGYDIIAGSLNLMGADMIFNKKTGKEYILKKILDPLKKDYDYCIIDTPPTLGILTVNALTASNEVIVPMGADIYSLQGLSQLEGMIKSVRNNSNKNLKIKGLLLTKYNPKAVINRQLKSGMVDISKKLKTKVFSTCIRDAIAVKEIAFMRENIFEKYPKAKVTQDYISFINEFLEN